MTEYEVDTSTPTVELPPSEYGIENVAESRPIDEDERRRLREEYGWIRTYFKLRPHDYNGLQRSLNQSRMGSTYDEYLATSLRYAIVASVLGALLGLLVTYLLATVGVFEGLTSPLAGVRGGVVEYIAANKTLFGGAALTLVLGGIAAASVWFGRYYYPTTVVSARRQNIDIVLPHAIVYMYALSHGGMSLVETMRLLADADDVYGEVAKEFEMIVTDVDMFGSDIYTALQNARNLTPSENLEQFLDDLIGVLDSGADVTTFFESESETYLRQAEEEQEDFLETLSMMAEIFVVGFVAAPLFLIVTLVVISLIGGSVIPQISLLVYLVIPLAMVAFLVVIDVLSQPFEQVHSVPEVVAYDRPKAPEQDSENPDERLVEYGKRQRLLRMKELLSDPLPAIEMTPVLSLVVSVPLALVAVAVMVASGSVEASLDAMLDDPIRTTTALVVFPFLVVAVPLSIFHELKTRRENEIARRFPDTLNILSSANKMGIPLTEGLALVSRWSDGIVAEEIKTVRNDIQWNHDVTAALLAFANRLRVPQLARTMKLLADGIHSSGDLSRVLAIAAEDTRNRAKMERARRRELSSYVAVVVIGFLVFLLVVVMLDASFLGPVSEVGASQPSTSGELPVSFINVPVNVYTAVFFHAALIMGVGSGVLAGKLAENDAFSGLKYAILMVAITMVAFLVI
ncbi:type II secretion system F family protein [Halorarius litoreus]|uniref:type II secretion system F family protein n=1 Tax=Halorarius litoreus TaxID=2962676 RepID=UPI0020CFBD06|nr:type II secretion system F family protein [Halorarius litoreus]